MFDGKSSEIHKLTLYYFLILRGHTDNYLRNLMKLGYGMSSELFKDPEFIKLTREYLEYLQNLLDEIFDDHLPNHNLPKIQKFGHNVKGTGGGYGFDEFTEAGKNIEFAARDGLLSDLKLLLPGFQQMLKKATEKLST
jgi:hypothetical protein